MRSPYLDRALSWVILGIGLQVYHRILTKTARRISESLRALCFARVLFCQSTSNLRGGPAAPMTACLARKIHSDYFDTSYSLYTGFAGEKSEIQPQFFTQVVFKALWFRSGATYRKSKTSVGTVGETTALNIDSEISPSPPLIFTWNQKVRDLSLDFL